MQRRIVFVLSAALLLASAWGCRGRAQKNARLTSGAERSAPARPYEDAVWRFHVPAGWTVQKAASKDPNIHAVTLRSPEGFFARLTLIREALKAGAFPASVIRDLRLEYPSLPAEAYVSELGTQRATGFRYRLNFGPEPREGWVVSHAFGHSEISFLGQFPKRLGAAGRKELFEVARSLRLKRKAGGASLAGP